MMTTDVNQSSSCKICGAGGCDLSLVGCDCAIHAKCAPLSLILEQSSSDGGLGPTPKNTRPFQCFFCNSVEVTGIYVLPLCFDELDKAVEVRKIEAANGEAEANANGLGMNGNKSGSGTKRGRDDEYERHIEACYTVYSQGRKTLSSSLSDSDGQRTGRWTDEEVAYVDHLVTSFDQGNLPLPSGTKLSTFLGDMLLCKSSRLTKKMKNAKLSTRSFNLAYLKSGKDSLDFKEDFEVLSALENRFIKTMPSEASQLELAFNVTKQWRTYFSDLCVQVGYSFVDVSDWIVSLEELESRTASSEEKMRNVRRRRMGFQLKSEAASRISPSTVPSSSSHSSRPFGGAFSPKKESQAPPKLGGDEAMPPRRGRSDSEDLDNIFTNLMDDSPTDAQPAREDVVETPSNTPRLPPLTSGKDPFLQAIAYYLEDQNLPFQHADVWVPSFVSKDDSGDGVRLLHAGHVTRADQPSDLASQLHNFGEYSKAFSFEAGQGLPGRTYASNNPHWEFQLSELSESVFSRSGGAQAYGLRTATAIPLSTTGVGRMVVVLYSCDHVLKDPSVSDRCAAALAKYSPEPKWKLVIEIDESRAAAMCVNHSKVMNGSTDAVANIKESTPEFSDSQIISLLGDQLSTSHSSSDPIVQGEIRDMIPHFMAIRLLLLRPTERRTPEENEMIQILRSSFNAYARGNSRTGAELAKILAKEWICLKSIMLPGAPNNAAVPTLDSGNNNRNNSSNNRGAPWMPLQLPNTNTLSPIAATFDRSQTASPESTESEHASHQFNPTMHPADTSKSLAGPPLSLPMMGNMMPSGAAGNNHLGTPIMIHNHSYSSLNASGSLKRRVSQVSLNNLSLPEAS